ncbi:Metalloendoproteinase 5-MMP [Cardamine amara subsp. amara]|uniref:Metalloendoproteinase 5-MMP n=1 Tax=Cardamine amara subsp. amara TaxID=228776 RepID=A0ABD1BFX7_CARAN
MFPVILGGDRKVELAKDDIEGIQDLYGGNPNGDGGLKRSRQRETNGGDEICRWRGLLLSLSLIATYIFFICF